MTFSQKLLSFQIQLGKGAYGDSGFNTLSVSGLRASAVIDLAGLPSLGSAQIAIYGLPLDAMNQLSTLGSPQFYQRNNLVTVSAGDAQSGMAVIYTGNIQEGWADFNGAPDVVFNIQSHPVLIAAMQPVPPFSYNGQVDVATIISGIAAQIGFGFENSGVSAILSNPYLKGTARDQVESACLAANVYSHYDPVAKVIAIWPKSGSRNGAIPMISADTGMVGYPAYSGAAVSIRTEFNRSLRFGGQMQIQSIIKPACGTWVINKLTHNLASLFLENAPWFTEATGYRLGNPQMVAT